MAGNGLFVLFQFTNSTQDLRTKRVGHLCTLCFVWLVWLDSIRQLSLTLMRFSMCCIDGYPMENYFLLICLFSFSAFFVCTQLIFLISEKTTTITMKHAKIKPKPIPAQRIFVVFAFDAGLKTNFLWRK